MREFLEIFSNSDTVYLALGVKITIISILSAAALYIVLPGIVHKKRRKVAIPSCDIVTRTIIEYFPTQNVPVLVFVVWMLLFTVLGVVLTQDGEWLGSRVGIVITMAYSLMIPLLVGSYMNLIIAASDFLSESNLSDLKLTLKGFCRNKLVRNIFFWLYQFLLFVGAVAIIYAAMTSEQEMPTTTVSPWIEKIDGENFMSYLGALYYGFRGTTTIMALGLLFSLTTVWWLITQRNLVVNNPRALLTKEMRIKPEIRRLGMALMYCIVFGAVSTTVHGLALYLQYPNPNDKQKLVELMVSSTWLLWAILTILTTAFSVATLLWFHNNLVKALHAMEKDALEAIPIKPQNIESSFAKNSDDIKELTCLTDKHWEARERITTAMSKVSTWPLPKTGGVAFILSILLQVLSIMAAVGVLK